MESPVLPVVCALIECQGRVLLAQRPAHKPLGLKWEFPGGKVDPGESAEAALVREIREELLCEITLRHALPRFLHTYEHTTIEMIPFVCALTPASPAPQAAEHKAVVWALPEELADYDLAAADRPVVQTYWASAGMSAKIKPEAGAPPGRESSP